MFKLWGRHTSINVQKVMWTARELGLDYERIDVGGKFGGLDTPEYVAMNPNMLVPVLQQGDFILWESHAIVRYLLSNNDHKGLWPDDPQIRARADQWMDWAVSAQWPALRLVFLTLIRIPPDERDEAAFRQSVEQSAEMFTLLDKHLATHEYVAGDKFTAGDIPTGANCYRYLALECDRPELPNVKRWYDALQTRKAYRDVVMIPLE